MNDRMPPGVGNNWLLHAQLCDECPLKEHGAPTAKHVVESLDGSVCRCTGGDRNLMNVSESFSHEVSTGCEDVAALFPLRDANNEGVVKQPAPPARASQGGDGMGSRLACRDLPQGAVVSLSDGTDSRLFYYWRHCETCPICRMRDVRWKVCASIVPE